ncbi:MAG: hypothetical protein AB7O47_09110 [Flavobacteriales bacterium]
MAKITYLFGAGASMNALPIVNQMPERIKGIIDYLKKNKLELSEMLFFERHKQELPKNQYYYFNSMIKDFEWLNEESIKHASIDTYAKKLFIKRDEDKLRALKAALSAYFTFEQIINPPDKRYDAFYASLLTEGCIFPNSISILSWNYDSQFELSLAEYSNSKEITVNKDMLNSKIKYERVNSSSEPKSFGVYKINGSAGMYLANRRLYFHTTDYSSILSTSIVSQVVLGYIIEKSFDIVTPTLSFAWEDEYQNQSIIQSAIENSDDTEILVVIGYSFPFFNRDIDRKIIGNMKNLKKVYFQSPDATIINERFQAIKDNLTGIELVNRFDVEQFLIPNEF